jgi:hypothetical protein
MPWVLPEGPHFDPLFPFYCGKTGGKKVQKRAHSCPRKRHGLRTVRNIQRLASGPGSAGVSPEGSMTARTLSLKLLGQVGHVPAATQGADQLHRRRELAGFEIGECALIGKQRGFRSKHFEIGRDATLVALVGNVE